MKVFKLVDIIKEKKFGQLVPSETISIEELDKAHQQDDSLLYKAIRQGNAQLVKYLVDDGATLGSNKYTPFMLACFYGHLDVAKILYSKKSLDDRDVYGNTPLIYAARNGHTPVVKWLLEKGAEINAVNIHGDSALFTSLRFKHSETAQFLMNQPLIDTNVANVLSYKPVVIAVFNGYLEIAEDIHHDSVVLNRQYTENNTLLHMCAMDGNSGSVTWLLNHDVDPQPSNSYGLTPFELAAAKGHTNIMRLLMPKLDHNRRFYDALAFSMVAASMQGHTDVVDLVFTYKSNFSRLFVQFLLMSAAIHGHWDVMAKILDQYPDDMVKIMNKKYHYGKFEFNDRCTLLHAAAEKGYFTIVENLYYRGADIHAKDNNGDTVLHHAIRSGDINLVRWLCNHNVLVNEKNKQGNTPMHLAVQMESSEMIRCLLVHGASFTIENKQKETVEFLTKPHSKLSQGIEDFKAQEFEKFGLAPIHEAVMDGQDKALLQILPTVANELFTKSVDGLTPIEMAAHAGNQRPLLIMLLWQAGCNKQRFYVLAEEFQRKYHPQSKAYETFEKAQIDMSTFPRHRIEALLGLKGNLEELNHDKKDDKVKSKDKGKRREDSRLLKISSLKFFERSSPSTSTEELTSDPKIQPSTIAAAM